MIVRGEKMIAVDTLREEIDDLKELIKEIFIREDNLSEVSRQAVKAQLRKTYELGADNEEE